MQFKKLTLSLFAASALILGPVALDAQTSIDLGSNAQAAKGGNGGGNGGGSSNSNRGGSGNSSAKASSSFDDGNYKRGNALGHTKDKSLGNDRGAIASKLGALNAAHASANARLHASPNSRVGLIALYEQAVLQGNEYAAMQTDQELLDTLAESEASDDQQVDLAELQDLADKYLDEGTLVTEDNSTEIIAYIEAAIAERSSELESTSEQTALTEINLLESAANKTLSAEVVDEVNRLLGIESAYRAPGDLYLLNQTLRPTPD